MGKFIVRRIFLMIPTPVIISIVSFFMIQLPPWILWIPTSPPWSKTTKMFPSTSSIICEIATVSIGYS
ncbi:MAG: hypothetical protein GY801_23770 [bacterium]|nr:hypothetical protein [bacterium]